MALRGFTSNGESSVRGKLFVLATIAAVGRNLLTRPRVTCRSYLYFSIPLPSKEGPLRGSRKSGSPSILDESVFTSFLFCGFSSRAFTPGIRMVRQAPVQAAGLCGMGQNRSTREAQLGRQESVRAHAVRRVRAPYEAHAIRRVVFQSRLHPTPVFPIVRDRSFSAQPSPQADRG
jgi:hypothetical protein